MEKVINFSALKANHEEMKEKRAAKKAERAAKKAENPDKKPVGKTVGIVASYMAAIGAGAAAAAGVFFMNRAGAEAPIEMASETMEIPVDDSGVTESVEVMNF